LGVSFVFRAFSFFCCVGFGVFLFGRSRLQNSLTSLLYFESNVDLRSIFAYSSRLFSYLVLTHRSILFSSFSLPSERPSPLHWFYPPPPSCGIYSSLKFSFFPGDLFFFVFPLFPFPAPPPPTKTCQPPASPVFPDAGCSAPLVIAQKDFPFAI